MDSFDVMVVERDFERAHVGCLEFFCMPGVRVVQVTNFMIVFAYKNTPTAGHTDAGNDC